MQTALELRADPSFVTLSPEAGGTITRYASWTDTGPTRDSGAVEWLRPARLDAVARRAAGETSSFPLVPFSNRIRDARFHFRGRLIELPQDFRPEPHAIHGHGWRAVWDVIGQSETTATLEYRHTANEWPWAYRAQQIFELTADRLSVAMRVTNESADPMPVGFGMHPYFVRGVRIRAAVQSMWRTDDTRMPVELVDPPSDLVLDGGGLNPDASPLDNNFVGFEGRAVVEWPEWDARLTIDADPVFTCFVVYTPAGRDFFCGEPATNCIDAFNLADMGRTDTGLIVLAPGASVDGSIRLTPVLGAGLV